MISREVIESLAINGVRNFVFGDLTLVRRPESIDWPMAITTRSQMDLTISLPAGGAFYYHPNDEGEVKVVFKVDNLSNECPEVSFFLPDNESLLDLKVVSLLPVLEASDTPTNVKAIHRTIEQQNSDDKELTINAIVGKGFLSVRDALNMQDRGLAIFSGNQHNEKWDWKRRGLEQLELKELKAILMR